MKLFISVFDVWEILLWYIASSSTASFLSRILTSGNSDRMDTLEISGPTSDLGISTPTLFSQPRSQALCSVLHVDSSPLRSFSIGMPRVLHGMLSRGLLESRIALELNGLERAPRVQSPTLFVKDS